LRQKSFFFFFPFLIPFFPPVMPPAGSTRVTADPPPAMDDQPGPSGRTTDKRPNSTSPERALKRAKAVRDGCMPYVARRVPVPSATHAPSPTATSAPSKPEVTREGKRTACAPPTAALTPTLPPPSHTQNLLLELPSAPTRVAAPLPTPTNAWIAADRPSPPLRGDDKACVIIGGWATPWPTRLRGRRRVGGA